MCNVVGYSLDGGCYCPSCFKKFGVGFDFPLFAGDETNYGISCSDCLSEIESSCIYHKDNEFDAVSGLW